MDGELKEILDEIDALKDSEVYKKIPEIARMDDVDNVDKMTIKRAKYNCRNPRRLIEETLLKKGLFKNYLSRDYVVYRNVELTNGLIIMLYKKVSMNKKAKKINKEISKKLDQIDVRYVGFTSINGALTLSSFRLFSAVSAVLGGRDVILPEDVFRAYRTILKLINTDLSKIPLPPDKTDEEINQELDSLGSYKGKSYREIADRLYQATLEEYNLEEESEANTQVTKPAR